MPRPIIVVETLLHEDHRYAGTCGDWFNENNVLNVKVSELPDWRYEALIAIHEIVEAVLCRADGVTPEQVDVFDMAFTGEGEPGDDPQAPYRRQHLMATAIEKMMAAALGVDWRTYERAIDALDLESVSSAA